MEQCKVNGQDVFIKDLEDVIYYLRQLTNDDFAEIVEGIVEGKLSDKDDKIYDLEVELEEAQDEIDGLEDEISNLECQVRDLESELTDKANEIEDLSLEIDRLSNGNWLQRTCKEVHWNKTIQ